MDGYPSLKEEQEACKIFIEEQLDSSATYVKVLWMQDLNAKINQEAVEMGVFQ
jgi:hypothetical protein